MTKNIVRHQGSRRNRRLPHAGDVAKLTVVLVLAGGVAPALPASAVGARVTSLVSAPTFAGASSDGTRVFIRTTESLVGADADGGLFDVYERSGGETKLVSAPGTGATGPAEHATFGGASSDGTRVFFRTAESLVGADLDGDDDVYERSGGETTLVSAPGTGASGPSGGAFFAGASNDGARGFFITTESLVNADTDGLRDVYEHSGGETTLVSVPGTGASGSAAIASFGGASSDGSLVFFHTAESLVGADTDVVDDVYARSGGETRLVSIPGAGASGPADSAFFAGASNDGTRVFLVTAESLVGADADGLRDVYEHSGGETTLVSVAGPGGSGSAQRADFERASSDGTRAFFRTTESLVGADADGGLVDVYERSGGETSLVSAPGTGASSFAQRVSFAGASRDGTRVFFATVESDPEGGTIEVDVYERAGGVTTLVSAPGAGASGLPENASFGGASSDGTRAFFATKESLVGADADGLSDVYERSGGETKLVSAPGAGASGSAQSASFAGASSDGAVVFFQTAENLVGADTDGLADIYESKLSNAPPTLDSIGDHTVDEGRQLQFAVSATDADGDALTYSASNLPAGATFDPATRTFTWTPGFDQAGSYSNVRFEASDGTLTRAESITISVNDVALGDAPDGDEDEPTIGAYERRLSFSYRERKNKFSGRLLSEQAACVAEQKVSVFRKRSGRDAKLGAALTDGAGRYALKRKDGSFGRFYARVGEGSGLTGTCLPAMSRTVQIG